MMTLKELPVKNNNNSSSSAWVEPGSMMTVDPYFFASGTGSVLSESTTNHLRKISTGLMVNPAVRQLWFSRSASASPVKHKPSPKRVSVSALNSPSKTRLTRGLPDLELGDSPGKRVRQRVGPRSTRSTTKTRTSNTESCEAGAEEGAEFLACDLCEQLCLQSLDTWMDHLGEFHPIPARWPSARADLLSDEQKQTPYTAVVGSHKRRRPNITPRPLNSFMIFAQYLRRATLHLFPDAHNVHLSQRIGAIWRQLNNELREQYTTEACRLQRLHAIEFPDYKYQPKKRNPDVAGSSTAVSAVQPAHMSYSDFGGMSTLVTPSLPPQYNMTGLTPDHRDGGYDSPDGSMFLLDPVETQPIMRFTESAVAQKLSRSMSVTPQLSGYSKSQMTSYHLPSNSSVDDLNTSSIPQTMVYLPDSECTNTAGDRNINHMSQTEPHPNNSGTNLSLVRTKQGNETLAALVSETVGRYQSVAETCRSSSFLDVILSPMETTQAVTDWVQEKPRPKAIEDLLNAPALFIPEKNCSRTLSLEPLTVVTHISPRITISHSRDSRHSHVKEKSVSMEPTFNSDSGLLPSSLTPSLSTISPDSVEQESVSVACGTYWEQQKRVNSAPSMLTSPQQLSVNIPTQAKEQVPQRCPNITWNNTEAMQSLGDIAMLIENGVYDSKFISNSATRIEHTPTPPSSSEPTESSAISGEIRQEFDNIDTCGTSPSLEELGRLILFNANPQEFVNDEAAYFKQTNSVCENTCDPLPVGTSPTLCLPSISSWTFGGSLSR